MGAFSTLLYARVCEVDDARAGAFGGYRLAAFALGDSCLFQIRGGELVRSFPLETSAQFEADPIVLGSVDLGRDHLLQFAILDEMCYPGDELVLCTDAVAEWAVRCYEHGEPPVWSDFWQMSEDDWRSGVAWLRQERQMRIDDATMLMLRVVDDRVETPAGDEQPHERGGRSGKRRKRGRRVLGPGLAAIGHERPEIRFRAGGRAGRPGLGAGHQRPPRPERPGLEEVSRNVRQEKRPA